MSPEISTDTFTVTLRLDGKGSYECSECSRTFEGYEAWATRSNHLCACFSFARPIAVERETNG